MAEFEQILSVSHRWVGSFSQFTMNAWQTQTSANKTNERTKKKKETEKEKNMSQRELAWSQANQKQPRQTAEACWFTSHCSVTVQGSPGLWLLKGIFKMQLHVRVEELKFDVWTGSTVKSTTQARGLKTTTNKWEDQKAVPSSGCWSGLLRYLGKKTKTTKLSTWASKMKVIFF